MYQWTTQIFENLQHDVISIAAHASINKQFLGVFRANTSMIIHDFFAFLTSDLPFFLDNLFGSFTKKQTIGFWKGQTPLSSNTYIDSWNCWGKPIMFDFIGNCLNSSRFLTPLGQGYPGSWIFQHSVGVGIWNWPPFYEWTTGRAGTKFVSCLSGPNSCLCKKECPFQWTTIYCSKFEILEKSIMVTSTSICNATLTSLLSRFLISLLSFYMPILYISWENTWNRVLFQHH